MPGRAKKASENISIIMLKLPKSLHRRLKIAAVTDGLTMQEIAREAFRKYTEEFKQRKLVERKEKK